MSLPRAILIAAPVLAVVLWLAAMSTLAELGRRAVRR